MKKVTSFFLFGLLLVVPITFNASILNLDNDGVSAIPTKKVDLKGKAIGESTRSIIVSPIEAYITEDNLLTIYFNSLPPQESVTITISDSSNETIIHETISVNSPETVSYAIIRQEGETYFIELSCSIGCLSGEF